MERNYEIYDKEMIAVIRGLENWRHLLESTKFKFEVQTNHKNLEYFIKAQKLNRKQVCWILYLLRFNLTSKHVPGTKIEKVGELSRRLDWKVEVEKDNENQKLIKEEQICSLVEIVIEGSEVDILEKIKIARGRNEKTVRVVEEINRAKVKVLRGDEQQVEGDWY